MTRFRTLVHIYALNSDGSGQLVAPLVDIGWARIVAEAIESEGFEVLIDPPTFGTSQNVIAWSPEGAFARGGTVQAAPWREYLEVRERHVRMSDAFDELYERKNSEDKYGDPWPSWRVRGE